MTAIWFVVLSVCGHAAENPPFERLLQMNPRGGRILRFSGLEDLTKPGAKWTGLGEAVFEPLPDAGGCYRVKFEKRGILLGAGSLNLTPNRNYLISVLLNSVRKTAPPAQRRHRDKPLRVAGHQYQ